VDLENATDKNGKPKEDPDQMKKNGNPKEDLENATDKNGKPKEDPAQMKVDIDLKNAMVTISELSLLLKDKIQDNDEQKYVTASQKARAKAALKRLGESQKDVDTRVERFDRRGTEPFEPFDPFEPFEFFQNRNFL